MFFSPDRLAAARNLKNLFGKFGISILAASVMALPAAAVPQPGAGDAGLREWNFDVYLGDSKVGYHNFRLAQDGNRERLISEANFKVRFAFITLYQYEHRNMETWEDDCLQKIESSTNANGKRFEVRGSQAEGVFEIEATGRSEEVEGCVMSFAYWNPDFLEASALLNSQTGEILPVDVNELGEEVMTIRGRDIPTRRVRVRAKDLDLDLWYSMNREWLGLRSTTRDGRIIRYVLS